MAYCECGHQQIEGRVSTRWCAECFGWSCRVSWVSLSPTSGEVTERLGSRGFWLPSDEWADRSLLRSIREASHEARLLTEELASGTDRLF